MVVVVIVVTICRSPGLVQGKGRDFVVGAHIVYFDSVVLSTGGKAITVGWDELHRVDVTIVCPTQSLNGLVGRTNVPQFGREVDGAAGEHVGITRFEGNPHGVGRVLGKGGNRLRGGNVPANTGGITRACQYFFWTKKSTTGNESVVTGHFHGPGWIVERVNGAQIVKSSAGYKISLRLFDTNGHDIR